MLRALAVLGLLMSACTRSESAAPPETSATARAPAPSASPAPSPEPPRACRYVFPLRPASAASYGRDHHDYPATDIFAREGTEVVSPVDGVLDWVTRTDPWQASVNDPATRGGLSVAIIGEDGIRYYGSHLLDVAEGLDPGDGVEAGAPLGHVGRTGNARSTPPHLHFGISKPTTPDDWQVRRGEVNPYDALNAWREGRAFTPQVPDARESRCVPAFSPGDA